MKYIYLYFAILLPGWALSGTPPPAPSAEPLQEVEVTGERPGPGMWRVSKGEHVLWLFGTLDPLPKRMTWRSRDVEAVVAQSQEVLAANDRYSIDARIGPIMLVRLYMQYRRIEKIPENSRLKDWLTPAQYARFSALKARYAPHEGSLEKMRPFFAAGKLYEKAIESADLVSRNDIQQEVLKLARRHSVPVQRAKVRVDDPRGALAEVAEIPREAEIACLDATMERLETDFDAMRARARDWALGDVDALRKLPSPKQIQVCWSALLTAPQARAAMDKVNADWNAELDAALARNRTTLALKPIYDLISADGTLARLRAKGYSVEGP